MVGRTVGDRTICNIFYSCNKIIIKNWKKLKKWFEPGMSRLEQQDISVTGRAMIMNLSY